MKKVMSVCVYLFFFGVYLYFCNIFLSLPWELERIYNIRIFFLSRILTFLHTYYIPRHTRSHSFAISITDIRTPLHSLPFVFPMWILFVSSYLSIARYIIPSFLYMHVFSRSVHCVIASIMWFHISHSIYKK